MPGGGGVKAMAWKKKKTFFWGGVQSKSQEKLRKNEKSENKKLIGKSNNTNVVK